MYNRLLGDGFINPRFIDSVESFVEFAKSHPECMDGEKLRCPCNHRKCQNKNILDEFTVMTHLGNNVFVPNYYRWYHHGEIYIPDPSVLDNHQEEALASGGGEEKEEDGREENEDGNKDEDEEEGEDENENMSDTPSLVVGSPDAPGSIDIPIESSNSSSTTRWVVITVVGENKTGGTGTGPSKHTGGSMSTAIEMSREPNSWEIFKKLHLKRDDSFVDAKSKRINVQDMIVPVVLFELQLWINIFPQYCVASVSRSHEYASSSDDYSVNVEEGNILKREVVSKLRALLSPNHRSQQEKLKLSMDIFSYWLLLQ
ncbi:putative multidrug and toxin extrusion protein 2-like [Capsicum annuum]|nr:putative multidrug and toxin extrusion protein 2-like [Capsicum annuum]